MFAKHLRPLRHLANTVAWVSILLLGCPISSVSQSVVATVDAGHYPIAIAVNPVTNKIYVANDYAGEFGFFPGTFRRIGATITVIDGATNKTTMIAAGDVP